MLKRLIAANAQGPRFSHWFSRQLTLFYFLHEELPRLVPSAVLLAPVAIMDGLCYAAGIPGIYVKALPMLIVNFVFAGTLCGLGCFIQRRGRATNI